LAAVKPFHSLTNSVAFDLTRRLARRKIQRMSTVMSIGLSGMKAAETRADIRAVNIVQAPVQEAKHFTPVQTTKAARPVVRAQHPAADSPRGPFANLAEDIIDLKAAAHAYRACAAVVRTGAAMERTLVDALS
jgi:flagellar basal body rod protein FlgC